MLHKRNIVVDLKRERRTDGAKPTNRTANATTDMAQVAQSDIRVSYNAKLRAVDPRWSDTSRAFHMTRTGCNDIVVGWLNVYAGTHHGARMLAQTLTETARDCETSSASMEFEWMGEQMQIVVHAVKRCDF